MIIFPRDPRAPRPSLNVTLPLLRVTRNRPLVGSSQPDRNVGDRSAAVDFTGHVLGGSRSSAPNLPLDQRYASGADRDDRQ